MRLILLFLLSFVIPAVLQAQEPGSLPEARGTWVLDSRLGSPDQIDLLMQRLADAGFNMAYIRTWYDGATIYPSDVVEAAGGKRQHGAFIGRDPLAEAIASGKRYGIGVAAWMEYGLATKITSGANEPGPILRAHPDWRMISQAGDTVIAHTNGTFSYWMDPAHPEVVAFQAALATEVAARYPDLVAFEADRIRYPDLTWSYSPVSVARYMAQTGQPDPTAGSATYGRFRKGTLNLLPDTAGLSPINPDSIGVSLDLAGASVRYHHPLRAGRIQPYVGLGAGLYYWVARREAYPSAGLADASRRSQWSGAAHVGVGTWIHLTPRLRADAGTDGTILPGELWAAQRIRLGNVRTFPFVTPHLGLLLIF